MSEIWKPIEGYENKYEVSNFGNVKRIKSGRILKPNAVSEGYLRVCLCDGRWKHKLCHRLVGKAFIENPNNYPQIDHIDADKINNRVENLRWVTNSMNCLLKKPMKRESGLLRGVTKSGNKFLAKIKIDGKYKYLGTFDTPEEASIVYEDRRKQNINSQGVFNNLN